MYRHYPTCPQQVENEARWLAFATPEDANQETALRPEAESADHDVRHDLVARVRREIADGMYDTEERWEAALDHLSVRLREV